jgi:hypothetical protein
MTGHGYDFGDTIAARRVSSASGTPATERKWTQEASQPGGDHLVSLLSEYRAAWALIRQWTGHDPAIAQREAQIQRLERLVWDAVYALQKAGLDREAARLRRALGHQHPALTVEVRALEQYAQLVGVGR